MAKSFYHIYLKWSLFFTDTKNYDTRKRKLARGREVQKSASDEPTEKKLVKFFLCKNPRTGFPAGSCRNRRQIRGIYLHTRESLRCSQIADLYYAFKFEFLRKKFSRK